MTAPDPAMSAAVPPAASSRRLSAGARVLATVLLGVLLASGCALLETKERELTWRPNRTVAAWYRGLPPGVEELSLPVHDEAGAPRIHAWWWPAATADAPAVLYLHGARWNLTGQLRRIEALRAFGFAVLAIDYRGFGRSDGELPSEPAVYADAQAGWRALSQRQPDPARRYVYGHSLGGAVAVDLASRISATPRPGAAGLIVESSFTSLAEVAAAMSASWLPVGLVLSQKFDSAGKLAAVRMPVLVVHGTGDHYVPARLSEALYEAAVAPKKLLLIAGAGHNNSMWVGHTQYREALTELFGWPPAGEEPAASPG